MPISDCAEDWNCNVPSPQLGFLPHAATAPVGVWVAAPLPVGAEEEVLEVFEGLQDSLLKEEAGVVGAAERGPAPRESLEMCATAKQWRDERVQRDLSARSSVCKR